ncbi:MAG: alcohol dehydrogenase catalytic domain-containing protein [Candidatus Kryptoniota bacterium]
MKPLPVRNGEVRIRVLTCGICGTDSHIIKGESRATLPVVLGHEFGGVVVDVGSGVDSVIPGDVVAVDPNIHCGECPFCKTGRPNFCANLKAVGVDLNGGMAELCTVPATQVYKVPSGFNFSLLYLVEPLSCVIHGIDMLNIKPGEKILIVGGGNIGLLFALTLHNFAGELAIIEKNPRRLQNALSLNIRKFNEDSGKTGFDAVVEATGTVDGFLTAIRYVVPGGRILQFGVVPSDLAADLYLNDVYARGVSIIGSYLNPYTFDRAIRLLSSSPEHFLKIQVSHFSLDEYKSAFEASRTGSVIKAVFRIGEV